MMMLLLLLLMMMIIQQQNPIYILLYFCTKPDDSPFRPKHVAYSKKKILRSNKIQMCLTACFNQQRSTYLSIQVPRITVVVMKLIVPKPLNKIHAFYTTPSFPYPT
jgi:hypothetical protein